MTTKPVLYSYFRSSAAWRVRIAMAIKGVEYEYRPVSLIQGEHHSEEFLALNPMGQLPCLVIDGLTLTQSLPIIEYLDETRPGINLLPKDPAKRYQARQIAEIINSGIHPLQNLSVLQKVAKLAGDDSAKTSWAHDVIDKGFKALEVILEKTAGKYCVGDEVTLADLALVPQVYNATRFNVDLNKFPTIVRVHKELSELESFKVADYRQQPDCPEDLK